MLAIVFAAMIQQAAAGQVVWETPPAPPSVAEATKSAGEGAVPAPEPTKKGPVRATRSRTSGRSAVP